MRILSLTFLISAVFDLLPLVISGNLGHALAVVGLRVMTLRLARYRGMLCCAESEAEFVYCKRKLGIDKLWELTLIFLILGLFIFFA